jgi:hypothetical protein
MAKPPLADDIPMKVRLIWWNVENFAHFDSARAGEVQWPASGEAFQAKVDLLAAVLGSQSTENPTIIALAETTRRAAEALRDRLFPGYSVFSLDLLERSDLHVAFIYPPGEGYSIQPPFVAQYVPRGTRPMAVLDIVWKGHRIRTIACHWTARFTDASEKTRSDTARDLSRFIFEYLSEPDGKEERHVIVVGDLNEEPFGLLERDLFAQRERFRAQRVHWSDRDVKRRYLYNMSWRMLGERVPYSTSAVDSAGTYYWPVANEWRTYDHIIVDGSLVGEEYPRIEEGATGVVTHPELFRAGRFPARYWWDGAAATGGVSDHLPLTTILHLGATNV